MKLSLAFLFGTGMDEWALLGAIAFLLFGPKRLPEIARTLGRTLEKLRRAADDFREQVAHLDDPLSVVPPSARPVRLPAPALPPVVQAPVTDGQAAAVLSTPAATPPVKTPQG